MRPIAFIHNAARVREIVAVLMRNGFMELFDYIHTPQAKWLRWRDRPGSPPREPMGIWVRIRVTFEQLGPTFIKFGQILASRPDVLPAPLIAELRKLRSQVPPQSWDEIKTVVLEELDGTIEDTFSEFDTTPVAAGSIGQVYRARLRSNGKEVAVKVRRSKIRKVIRSDLQIIEWFAHQLHEKIEDLRAYDLPDIVRETGEGILRELDFTIEGSNTAYFNAANPMATHVFSPHIYDEFTSQRMLVMEWIDGVSCDKVDLPAEQRAMLANYGGKSVLHQIFIMGFFHGDPHTGNILITRETPPRLALVDWGLAGQLTRQMRYFLADLFAASAEQDPERLVRVVLSNALTRKRIDSSRLQRSVAMVLQKYPSFKSGGEPVGKLMLDLLYLFGSNGIQLARDYSLLAKAIVSIEDAARLLDPAFDIRTVSKPYLEKLKLERLNPMNLGRDFYWSVKSTISHLRDFPATFQRLLHAFEDGQARIRLEHTGLDNAANVFSRSVNRLVLAILIGSLLMGSSAIITTGVDPKIAGYPALGVIGFGLAFLFFLALVWDIIRPGRN